MKLKQLIPTFCFCLFIILNCEGQSHFLLMGGQEFNGKIISEEEEYFVVEFTKKNGTKKEMNLPLERIFSITTSGKEQVYYVQDTSDEETYSVEEMKLYIFGHQDASRNHKVALSMIVSAGVAGGLGLYLGSQNNAFLLLSPIAGALAGGFSQNNKPKPKNARSQEVLASPAYVEGYRKGARSKKLINSFKFAIAGGIVGSVTGLMIYSNNPNP